jgi:hypothetical protein
MHLGPFILLFASAGVFLERNGTQATLIAICADAEGFSSTEIGLKGMEYFPGFVIACLFSTRLIRRVGQIRLFGTFAAMAAVAQYPFGSLFSRVDRRWSLIAATSGAVGAGLFLPAFGHRVQIFAFFGIFLFGAFSLPLYSLSAAHANDFAKPGEYVELSIAIILTFSADALFGPRIVSVVRELRQSPVFPLHLGLPRVAHSVRPVPDDPTRRCVVGTP